MGRKTPDIIKQAARDLRANMTQPESILWNELRDKKIGYKINRQSPIYVFTEDFGSDRYIISDFYCPEKKLIIEIDGSVHNRKEVYLLDREKEKLLIKAGYNILRFKNNEVQSNMKGIILKIQAY